jgi:hypothetical protein
VVISRTASADNSSDDGKGAVEPAQSKVPSAQLPDLVPSGEEQGAVEPAQSKVPSAQLPDLVPSGEEQGAVEPAQSKVLCTTGLARAGGESLGCASYNQIASGRRRGHSRKSYGLPSSPLQRKAQIQVADCAVSLLDLIKIFTKISANPVSVST